MAISLGFTPYDVIAVLSRGADWIWRITPTEGAPSPLYPDDTVAQVLIYSIDNEGLAPAAWAEPIAIWDGVFDGDDIYWHIESADTDEIPDGSLVRINLIYSNPPADDNYLWARGKVKRRD